MRKWKDWLPCLGILCVLALSFLIPTDDVFRLNHALASLVLRQLLLLLLALVLNGARLGQLRYTGVRLSLPYLCTAALCIFLLFGPQFLIFHGVFPQALFGFALYWALLNIPQAKAEPSPAPEVNDSAPVDGKPYET